MSKYHNPDKVSYFTKGDRKLKIGGYRRSAPEATDKVRRATTKQLPPKVDLRPFMTKVENQGAVGSCTANAMAGAYEYLAKRHLGEAADVSRLFIYYNAREYDGNIEEDAGTTLRNCINVLRKKGACSEVTWPYKETAVFDEPHEHAYDEAKNFLIEECERIPNDLNAWKSCLAEGYPIAFGLELFDSFDKIKRDGRIRTPDPDKEEHTGGHAMLCVGYSEVDKVFIVRNSWGTGWGDKGYCYIPYNYMLNEDFNDGDSWAIMNVTDLDFSSGIVQDEESVFYEDGTLVIYDLYIYTEKGEKFETELEKLCEKYVVGEEYGYESFYDENDETLLYVDNFYILVDDPEAFVLKLSALCSKYVYDGLDDNWDYSYAVEGADLTEETEEETECTEGFPVTEFHIRTEDHDKFVAKLEKLCTKYGQYAFDHVADDEDEEILRIDNFSITSDNIEEFLEKLEALCAKEAIDEDYWYHYEGMEEDYEISENQSEGALAIQEFSIRTVKAEAFIEKLEALCAKYAADDDYNYDCNYHEDDLEVLLLENFYINAADEEAFIEKLEALCEKYAVDEDYSFEYESGSDS